MRRLPCHLSRLCCLVAALGLPGTLLAHGDEDHGDAPHPVAPAAAQVARVEAASDLFELVGTLKGDKLTLHLDRYASNEPVSGAQIEVESGPIKATAIAEAAGLYSVQASGLAEPGSHALVFTVQAGDSTDLLNGDLLVAAAAAPPPAAAAATLAPSWWAAAGGVAVLLAASLFAWRRRRPAVAGVTR